MSNAANDGIKKVPPKTMVLPNGNGILYVLDDGEEDSAIRPAQLIPRIQSEPVADLREEVGAFQAAMEQIQRDNQHRFLSWREVLETIHALGYRRVAEPTLQLDASDSVPPAKSTN
jgi:hypothetical protein